MSANIITLSRIPFSVLLLAFKPNSYSFIALYLLCGITDVLDGFIARKLHTESKNGAILDSIADLIFAVIYVVKILPLLSIPCWIRIWTAIIAVIKTTGIALASKKAKKLSIEHSFGNKLTGILLFVLPLSVNIIDVKYSASVVCTVAAITAIGETIRTTKTRVNNDFTNSTLDSSSVG